MKWMAFAGAAALALSVGFVSPVTADKSTDQGGGVELLQEKVPAPTDLKINEGSADGHKLPMDVYKKALKAAKGGDLETLRGCFNPNNLDFIDEKTWENDGDEELTYLGAVAKALKGYSEEGAARAQGKVGDYAVITVRNGEAVNLVKVVRTAKYSDDGKEQPKNWYLSSFYASEYRIDYNAADVKTIKDAIDKGDLAKFKEFLDPWQTQVLDLLDGVQEGVDPYALLLKRVQLIAKNADAPTILVDRSGTGLAYWFHNAEKGTNTFLCLRFVEDYDWRTEKRFTSVKFDISSTTEFHRDAKQAFDNYVQDWSW
jgi:hypothetical protein